MDTEQQNLGEKEARVPEMDLSPDFPSIDEKAEKKLIRKMDTYILPFVVLLYLFSFLDRGMLPGYFVQRLLTCDAKSTSEMLGYMGWRRTWVWLEISIKSQCRYSSSPTAYVLNLTFIHWHSI